jgi:hypothetical protein
MDGMQQCVFKYFYVQETNFKYPGGKASVAVHCDPNVGWGASPIPATFGQRPAYRCRLRREQLRSPAWFSYGSRNDQEPAISIAFCPDLPVADLPATTRRSRYSGLRVRSTGRLGPPKN